MRQAQGPTAQAPALRVTVAPAMAAEIATPAAMPQAITAPAIMDMATIKQYRQGLPQGAAVLFMHKPTQWNYVADATCGLRVSRGEESSPARFVYGFVRERF